jgi:hypothetical protein
MMADKMELLIQELFAILLSVFHFCFPFFQVLYVPIRMGGCVTVLTTLTLL